LKKTLVLSLLFFSLFAQEEILLKNPEIIECNLCHGKYFENSSWENMRNISVLSEEEILIKLRGVRYNNTYTLKSELFKKKHIFFFEELSEENSLITISHTIYKYSHQKNIVKEELESCKNCHGKNLSYYNEDSKLLKDIDNRKLINLIGKYRKFSKKHKTKENLMKKSIIKTLLSDEDIAKKIKSY